MRIGLALPHYDFSFPSPRRATVDAVVDYARRAESSGFDSVWVSDHLFLDLARYGGEARRYGSIEAMTLLGAIGAATSSVRLGPLVLCSAFRNAVVLAAQASAIDELSGGRLEVALGAGWYQEEFEAAGIPFGTPGERVEQLARVAATLRASGLRAPIVVGSKGGPGVARVIATHADGWNLCWRIVPGEYRERRRVLDAACERVGRDPASVRRSVGTYCLLGESERDVTRRFAALRRWTPGGALAGLTLDEHRAGALVGTPETCAERVEELASLGVEEVIVAPASLPFAVHDDEQLDLIAEHLIPLVRS